MVFGIAVAVGALIEVARRSASGAFTRAAAVLGGLLVCGGAIIPLLGLSADPVLTPLFAVVLSIIAIAIATATAIATGVKVLLFTRATPQTTASLSPPTLVA